MKGFLYQRTWKLKIEFISILAEVNDPGVNLVLIQQFSYLRNMVFRGHNVKASFLLI